MLHRSIALAGTASGWLVGWLFAAAGLAATASDYRSLGLSYRQQGDFAAAIEAMQQATELEPENLDGKVLLGWTHHLAGDDRTAAEVLQNTLRQNPSHVPALNALGIVYLVNEDLLPALLTHGWAAWLQPDNEVAYYNLSLAFEAAKHYDWAIQTAEKACTLEPDNPHPWVALAIAQWGKQDVQAATQTYQRAIDLDRRYADPEFLNYLNEAGFSDRQIDASKEVLNAG